MSLTVIHSGPTFGDRQFRCQCGETFMDGGEAIRHSFEGHEVVREQFAGGRWTFESRVPVMQMLIDRLRARGESIYGFTQRLNARREQLEREEHSLG